MHGRVGAASLISEGVKCTRFIHCMIGSVLSCEVARHVNTRMPSGKRTPSERQNIHTSSMQSPKSLQIVFTEEAGVTFCFLQILAQSCRVGIMARRVVVLGRGGAAILHSKTERVALETSRECFLQDTTSVVEACILVRVWTDAQPNGKKRVHPSPFLIVGQRLHKLCVSCQSDDLRMLAEAEDSHLDYAEIPLIKWFPRGRAIHYPTSASDRPVRPPSGAVQCTIRAMEPSKSTIGLSIELVTYMQ